MTKAVTIHKSTSYDDDYEEEDDAAQYWIFRLDLFGFACVIIWSFNTSECSIKMILYLSKVFINIDGMADVGWMKIQEQIANKWQKLKINQLCQYNAIKCYVFLLQRSLVRWEMKYMRNSLCSFCSQYFDCSWKYGSKKLIEIFYIKNHFDGIIISKVSLDSLFRFF